jgi:CobQ/CobB/MinD/ParA nucleotide binding domain
MAKDNPNGNEEGATNGSTITPTIHLVLQGKGGVGKTVVAGWLSEFLISRGQAVQCIDGDPVNRSLAQYKALPVEKLDLVNQDGVVVRSCYDGLIDRFLNEEAVFVLDSGATAFLPFWSYIVESDIIAVLREAGRRVYVHIPISGGEMLNDTLLGFKTLAETAAEKSLVVWVNEYFGPIKRDGKTFDQMQVFLDHREKVLTSIGIPQRSADTFGENVRRMRERKLTFQEAIGMAPGFYLLEKSRLYRVRQELYEQLKQTPFA